MLTLSKLQTHLLAVEEDDELDCVYEWQQRAKQSSCPDHSLTINEPEHVGGNRKLLPTHPLGQLTGPVIHHHPEANENITWHQYSSSKCPTDSQIFICRYLCAESYLRGNSTSTSRAMLTRRSNRVSLYISCPTRVSQH